MTDVEPGLVDTTGRPVVRDDALDPDIGTTIHCYPRDPRYGRSGNPEEPQPGDIALCGWVKQAPHRPGYLVANCLMCIRLRELKA